MDKKTLTKEIIEHQTRLGALYDIEKALKDWWWPTSSLNPGHMRLTKTGYHELLQVVNVYEFEFHFNNTPKQLKMLAKMPVPYYVDYTGHIAIFSKDLAVMVKMYENFDRYLELIQND